MIEYQDKEELVGFFRGFYRERIHSSNNNLSPVAFEEKMMLQVETAA